MSTEQKTSPTFPGYAEGGGSRDENRVKLREGVL